MRMLLLITIAVFILGCGLASGREAPEQEVNSTDVAPPPTIRRIMILEQEVLKADLIVRARLNAPEIHVSTDAKGRHVPTIKFNLGVLEVLKGVHDSEVVQAIWIYYMPCDARADALALSEGLIADRDTQWDGRDAILFLSKIDGQKIMEPGFLSTESHYFLGVLYSHSQDDSYSLNSKRRRRWLPAASTSGQGDGQEFLLTPPPSAARPVWWHRVCGSGNEALTSPTYGGTTTAPGESGGTSTAIERVLHPDGESTTLRNLKQLIEDVTAEYNGGDGSEDYRNCVEWKYKYLEYVRNAPIVNGVPYTIGWEAKQTMDSGQAANTTIVSREVPVPREWNLEIGDTVPVSPTIRFLGKNAHLFAIGSTPARTSGSSKYDLEREELLQIVRPLPAGVYELTMEVRPTAYAICNFAMKDEYTITVIAPEATLHEMFFDPFMDGAAVGAGDSTGQLDPASFTDANGASATIEHIKWVAPSAGSGQAGTVKVKASPHTGLAGHRLDFFELDGTVSLSLDVVDATVDDANETLAWEVSSQPWEDGDKLMVRISEVQP